MILQRIYIYYVYSCLKQNLWLTRLNTLQIFFKIASLELLIQFQTMTHQNLFDLSVSHYASFLTIISIISTLPTKNPKHPRKNKIYLKKKTRKTESEKRKNTKMCVMGVDDAERDRGREIRNTFITICSSRFPLII